jgi:hypothetical protein
MITLNGLSPLPEKEYVMGLEKGLAIIEHSVSIEVL